MFLPNSCDSQYILICPATFRFVYWTTRAHFPHGLVSFLWLNLPAWKRWSWHIQPSSSYNVCQWAWENIIAVLPFLMLTLWTVSTISASPYKALIAHGIHVRITNICVLYECGKAYIYWQMPEFVWKSCTFCALKWSHLYSGYKYSI